MVSGTLRAKGRHARPAAAPAGTDAGRTTSPAAVVRRARSTAAGAAGALWPASRRTRLVLVGAGGLSGALAAALAAFVAALPGGSGDAPKAAVVSVLAGRPAPVPAAVSAARPARAAHRGDPAALAYYESRDPARAAHVTEVVWTGPMLRVYTDLPASDADSKAAVALCETAVAYAEARNRIPEVFVHANRTAGYQVLANKMSARDDCRLGRVP
jgi:hypothetical protein